MVRRLAAMNEHAATLEIFKAGTHIAEDGREMTFTEADLQEIADNYDPVLSEAPIVIGHPKSNTAPAYGWAQSVFKKGRSLFAVPHQVEPQFAELVNAGRYKKISPSIYLPDSPGNPTPGKHNLKHIGFLGAIPPSVKGMRSASFAEGDGAVSFSMNATGLGWALTDIFQRIRDAWIDEKGLEAADKVIPQWQIRSIGEYTADKDESNAQAIAAYAEQRNTNTPEIAMSQENKTAAAEFAERETKLNAQATELSQREQAIAEREAKAQREDAAAFCEGLVNEGKLLPRQKASTVELLLALPANTALNFAEGDKTVSKPAGEVLRTFLSDLPKQVDLSEKSRGEGGAQAVSFSAPAGVVVDAAGAELYNKAKAYQAQNPNVSWMDAVAAVGG
jgi:hypothetical protein